MGKPGNPYHDARTGEFTSGGSSGHNAGKGNREVANKIADQHKQVDHLENVVSSWTKGQVTSKQVQKQFKKAGWKVDLRRGNYEVEAYDPTGKMHLLTP